MMRHLRWLHLIATLSVLLAAAASLASSPPVSAAAVTSPSAGPATIAPWKRSDAHIRFVGDEVRLSWHGASRVVARDDAKRLDPVFSLLAAVSPDGHALLYATAADRGWRDTELNVVDLTTLQRQVVATFATGFWPQVRWSPDGRRIAYALVDSTSGKPALYVMGANGASPRRVVAGGAFTRASLQGYEQAMFGWSNDDSALVYYDDALAPHVVYTVSLADGTAKGQPTTLSPATISVPSTQCNAPLYAQGDSRWGSNIMYTAGATITNEGCAVTSVTMMVDYYGANYDPGSMNTCLGNSADPLYWDPVATGCSSGRVVFDNATNFAWPDLNTALNAGHPTPVGIQWSNGGTHWVLAVGGDGSNTPANYAINDPAYGTRRTLADIVNAGGTLSWLRFYHPTSGSWPSCTPPPPPPNPDTPLAGHWVAGQTADGVGLYDPTSQKFYLRNSQTAGAADETISFGSPGDLPVVGDWTGSGVDTIGVYRPSNATFYLASSNTQGASLVALFQFGAANAGWIPISGDWTHLGHDGVGLYNPATQTFYLRNTLTTGSADITLSFGVNGDQPIVGRVPGAIFDSIGIYRPSTATFYLVASNAPGAQQAVQFIYGPTNSGWIPFTGAWTGSETDGPGLYDHTGATMYLRNTLTGGAADKTFLYGNSN